MCTNDGIKKRVSPFSVFFFWVFSGVSPFFCVFFLGFFWGFPLFLCFFSGFFWGFPLFLCFFFWVFLGFPVVSVFFFLGFSGVSRCFCVVFSGVFYFSGTPYKNSLLYSLVELEEYATLISRIHSFA